MKKVLIWIGCFLVATLINLLLLPLGLGLGAIPMYLITVVLARHLCKKTDKSTYINEVRKEAFSKEMPLKEYIKTVVPSELINFCETHKGETLEIKENFKMFSERKPIPKRYLYVLLEMYGQSDGNTNKQPKVKENKPSVAKKVLAVIAWLISIIISGGLIQCGITESDTPTMFIIGLILGIISVIVVPIIFIRKINIKKNFKQSIIYKERCYKKIAKFHKYYESGAITEEEFESIKQDILNKIK